MELQPLSLEGVFLVHAKVADDLRGSFLKTYHKDIFESEGISFDYRESYYSVSKKNVVRGMHFQAPPADHDKLIYVTNGEILDVIVDIRKSSATYGQALSVSLSALGNSLFIPKGFAHGFLTISESATVIYNVSTVYQPKNDQGILWSSLDFEWPVKDPILSVRDKNFQSLQLFNTPF